jgi:hypothetical protein
MSRSQPAPLITIVANRYQSLPIVAIVTIVTNRYQSLPIVTNRYHRCQSLRIVAHPLALIHRPFCSRYAPVTIVTIVTTVANRYNRYHRYQSLPIVTHCCTSLHIVAHRCIPLPNAALIAHHWPPVGVPLHSRYSPVKLPLPPVIVHSVRHCSYRSLRQLPPVSLPSPCVGTCYKRFMPPTRVCVICTRYTRSSRCQPLSQVLAPLAPVHGPLPLRCPPVTVRVNPLVESQIV